MTLKTRTVVFVSFAVVAAALQLDVLRALFEFSKSDESASHIVLIPLVSLVLIYHRRDEVFASVRTASRGGLAVILVGVALAVAVRLQAPAGTRPDLVPSMVAVLTLWVGAFLLVYGWSALRAARFAMAFLVFMIPIPAALLEGATQVLKRGSTEAVAALFTLTATPYHREGFVFSLPRLSIEIADECSGIRSSIALLLTALLAGHMFLKSAWSKTLLVIAVLPLAVFKNGLRIVSLSLLASYVDPRFLVGQLHNDGGIVFFLLALALLLPVLAVLRRWDVVPELSDQRASPTL